jgi:hypothetical protein
MNLAETSCMPKFSLEIVAHDHRNIPLSSTIFYVVNHLSVCTKAKTALIFSPVSNVDGQVKR